MSVRFYLESSHDVPDDDGEKSCRTIDSTCNANGCIVLTLMNQDVSGYLQGKMPLFRACSLLQRALDRDDLARFARHKVRERIRTRSGISSILYGGWSEEQLRAFLGDLVAACDAALQEGHFDTFCW